ncbi:metal ABC transporter permease [Gracilaria domingensis]|nr:metal ABC transporter permease [Gracilaria domingensis]
MESYEVRVYSWFESAFQRLYTRFRLAVDSQQLFQRLIQSVALVISLLLAAIGVANNSLTPGDFVLISAYVAQLFGPLATIATSYRLLAQSIIDLDKCVSLLRAKSSVTDSPNALQLKFNPRDILAKQVGEIVFDRVSFSYPTSRNGVGQKGLREVTFKVAPGSTVALALFNQTLRENIAYGRPDASLDEIAEAADAAALMPLVRSLPLGLDSLVGERGVRLSGGERQRVGCARCILKSPAIVLLDEASSALDTRTEREIQTQLRRVCRNRSTIVVAHRLSTITMADSIVVLGEDRRDRCVTVFEQGSHKELLDKNGLYASLWARQTSS